LHQICSDKSKRSGYYVKGAVKEVADNNSEEMANEVCAHCGKAEVDEIKLKKCACNLVKYCTVDCQKYHRPQHKKACKKKMAEIREENLYRQPDESHLGECPICCLPLPLDLQKSTLNSCCCKRICDGCDYANDLREEEQGLEQRCLYCREPLPTTDEEINQNYMNRVKANDPVAMNEMGKTRYNQGNYGEAFEYYTKAAALGDIESHFELSCLYHEGKEGVEKDTKKAVHHSEEAAIGGHPSARFNLGCHEVSNGRIIRAIKHYIIAANLGDDGALEQVKENFRRGYVSKEDFEAALRGHQAAIDATKSEQREEAYTFFKRRGL
jgi:tetratricopeptide (TPR) repeat protein